MTPASYQRSIKPSGAPWLGDVPSHWTVAPVWSMYRAKKETGHPGERLLSVYRDYGVIEKSSRDDNKNRASEDLSGYQLVEIGDLVTNKMKTWQGSIAVSDIRGIVSPAYYVYRKLHDGNDAYFHHLFRSLPYITGYNSISKGIRVGQWDLDADKFRIFPALSPPRPEQDAIVKFIDAATTRIDALIAKKSRLIEVLRERIVARAESIQPDSETRWVRLKHVAKVVSRPVIQQPGTSYTKLGLFNRGRGIFKKLETDTDDMGDSDFHWVEAGDLVLSGQFAWEGAVAMARKEHGGCVVSHRYPLMHAENGVLNDYLFAYLMTKHGDMVLNDCSRGSAGRNRPLNMNLLLGWKIPVPPIAIQHEVAALVRSKERMEALQRRSIELLREHRSAVITAAVTGKIDLQEAA